MSPAPRPGPRPASRPGPRAARPVRRTRNRLLAAGAVLALTAGLALARPGSEGGGAELQSSFAAETNVLSYSGTTFAGAPLSSEQFRGTPQVINFYASWCTVCDREMPDFERVSQDLGSKIQFVGINPQSGDTDDAQAAMVERTGVTYPTLPDPQDALTRRFSAGGGLPVTLFVDGDGVVRDVHRGLLTEQQLRDRVAGALGVT